MVPAALKPTCDLALYLSDYQHCIGGHQGLTGQPGLLCFCQRSVKPTKVRRHQWTDIFKNSPHPSENESN